MVSVVPGLHQALVWAVQRVQQRGPEETGAEGGVSSTCPAIKDCEEGERGKDPAEMFRGWPESSISRHQNLDQQANGVVEGKLSGKWKNADSDPLSGSSRRGEKTNGSYCEVEDDGVDTKCLLLSMRLQSQLGFKLEDEEEDEEEEEDYGFDLGSSFKDEAVTLQCSFQSPNPEPVSTQQYSGNVAWYPPGSTDFRDEAVTLQCSFESPHSGSVFAQEYPENVTEYPENVPEYPENVTEYPENVTEYPENVPEYPENVTEYPENVTEYPENVPEYPENVAEYPTVGVEEEDDGWISDELIVPNLHCSDPTISTAPAMKSYMFYDDDVWVDEAKAVFAANKKDNPEAKLRPLLLEMFGAHQDVFSLILAFLRRSGKIRQPKLSLPRIVVIEFQKWLREKKSSGEESKNATLTPDHQQEALEILTRCHPVLLDDMCAIFDLKSANQKSQLSLIHSLLDLGKYKEAVTYTWKFQLQGHFSMEKMLLPLIAMDKINMIENYIGESRQLQCEFVMILDRLCAPGTSYRELSSLIASSCKLGKKGSTLQTVSEQQLPPNSKLNAKQLFKLAMRLIQMYNLKLEMFPVLSEKKASASLHYLLHKKYVEGSITDGNTDELIEAAVMGRPTLQSQLVKELVQFGDVGAAAHWAVQCKVPLEYLPFAVQSYLTSHRVRPTTYSQPPPPPSTQQPTHPPPPQDFYELPLPLNRVFFVEDHHGLQLCRKTLTQPGVVIGVDAEWRLPACNGGIERLAVLQLAVAGSVFLLDMVHLPRRVREKTLRRFISDVFGSTSTLKLGYGIEGDLHMLARSWVFVADIVASSERVVDLQTFSRMVAMVTKSGPSTNGSRDKKTLPSHPLLGPSHSSSPTPPPIPTSPPHKSLLLTPQHNPPPSEASSVGEEGLSCDPSVRRRGLSALVMRYLGKPLDKSQQLSDWEKRPLRVEQVKYAALDAYCLLELYSVLKSQALAVDPNFNVEPTISATKTGRTIFKRQKEEKGLKKAKPEVQNPPKRVGPPIHPRELSVVVDTMLQGLGRYLRCCGVNVKILSAQQTHYDTIKVCLKEGRIILTSGTPFFVLRDLVPAGMCVHINQGKARDQVLEVIEHFKIYVTEKDIFSRCQVCNGDDYVRIKVDELREIIRLVKRGSLTGLVTSAESSSIPGSCSEATVTAETYQITQSVKENIQNLSQPADIKDLESGGISETTSRKAPAVCTSHHTHLGDQGLQAPWLPRGSMTSVKDCCLATLGEGLHFDKYSCVVTVSHTGVVVQVAKVPEGILDRVTEFYCCATCGKVFWEGKHFAHVVHQFQHVLECARQLRHHCV